MVKTKFNPGVPVAMYESAESGISPLMVIPELHKKSKNILGGKRHKLNLKGQELKRRHSRRKKSDPRRPPRNWYELKDMLATFSALLWVLFGDVCPLYDQIYK